METMWNRFSARTAVIAAALLLCPILASASDLSSISGHVRDSSGLPVVGAMVIVTSPVFPARMVHTDKEGAFSVINLFAGQYSIRISMVHFLPSMKQGLQLTPGGTAVLTVSLQNALDVVRRAVAREKSESEDIIWTLRSSRSTQPVLRLADSGGPGEQIKTTLGPDYSGYFQLYSKSVETPAGTTEGVGSEFSVTMPLDTKSKVNVRGQYNDSPSLPRGIGASYDFVPAVHHKAEVGIDVRQGSLVTDPLQVDSSREIQLRYGDNYQWSDHIVLNYGAEAGRVGAIAPMNYLRPRLGISWVPQSRTTLTIGTSSQAPLAADDPVRGKDFFDWTVFVPPGMERYSHTEAGITHILGETAELTAAIFRDKPDTEALFASTSDGRPAILLLDTSNIPSQGFRLSANRKFQAFEAGVSYAGVDAAGIDNRVSSIDDIKAQMLRRKFHTVAVRFKADVTATQTEITSVYRWNSGFSISQLDPYQRLMDYNDPTLSFSIAQNLPTFRMLPARFQAILDARNVLDQTLSISHAQVGQYPRLLKGGINIRF